LLNMIGQGIHYAVTDDQMDSLLEAARQGDAAVLDALYVIEGVGDDGTPARRAGRRPKLISQSSDRAWELIHRALTRDSTPGGRLNPWSGRYPLNRCVLGGQHLKRGGCIMASLTRPEEVIVVASALARLDEPAMRRRVAALDSAASEFGVGEENVRYMWHWFEKLARFYTRAAKQRRAVVFKADRCAFSREPRYRPA
jgi:hypothetical protein